MIGEDDAVAFGPSHENERSIHDRVGYWVSWIGPEMQRCFKEGHKLAWDVVHDVAQQTWLVRFTHGEAVMDARLEDHELLGGVRLVIHDPKPIMENADVWLAQVHSYETQPMVGRDLTVEEYLRRRKIDPSIRP